jgi:FMN phosphatase YigB (HAD superfamily)
VACAFDLVVFDLGGVLVRIARDWADGHRLAGLPGEPPVDRAFRTLLGELSARGDGSLPGEELFEQVAAASGGVYTTDDVRRIGHAWLIEEYPGVGRVFDALDATSLGTAILSNTNDAHWARLKPDGGVPEFPSVLRADHHFASHLLGVMKPDPAIYRAVEEGTGCPSARILFFDDKAANVDGATAAGWAAVRVDPDGDPAAQMLDTLARRGVVG